MRWRAGDMHPAEHRRRPARNAERLKLLYIAVAVSCTLLWWRLNGEPERGSRLLPPRRVLRPPLFSSPPPAPDDPVSRAWRLRNEVLVDTHERSES